MCRPGSSLAPARPPGVDLAPLALAERPSRVERQREREPSASEARSVPLTASGERRPHTGTRDEQEGALPLLLGPAARRGLPLTLPPPGPTLLAADLSPSRVSRSHRLFSGGALPRLALVLPTVPHPLKSVGCTLLAWTVALARPSGRHGYQRIPARPSQAGVPPVGGDDLLRASHPSVTSTRPGSGRDPCHPATWRGPRPRKAGPALTGVPREGESLSPRAGIADDDTAP